MGAARLMLNTVPRVKADWVMMTSKLIQVALSFGADDLDDTVVRETIYLHGRCRNGADAADA